MKHLDEVFVIPLVRLFLPLHQQELLLCEEDGGEPGSLGLDLELLLDVLLQIFYCWRSIPAEPAGLTIDPDTELLIYQQAGEYTVISMSFLRQLVRHRLFVGATPSNGPV
jgi:hypothetical protein